MVRVYPCRISRHDRGTDLGSAGVDVPEGLGFFACWQGRNLVPDCCSANRAMVAPYLARPLAHRRASASAASGQAISSPGGALGKTGISHAVVPLIAAEQVLVQQALEEDE
jgi:hypothetical protein